MTKVSMYGIRKTSGAFATIYECPCCKFRVRVNRAPRNSNPGRGDGLRRGALAFAEMRNHVRSEHPEQTR